MEAEKRSERWNDWLFHYQYLFRQRYTKRQKRKFVRALATDLQALDADVRVENTGTKKEPAYRVVVHDPAKADQIIVTYFEGARPVLGDLDLLDVQDVKRKTMRKLGLDIACWLVATIALAGMFFRMKVQGVGVVVFGLGFLLLFGWARMIRDGSSFSPSLVRNTSSILAMLNMVECAPKSTAFVFVERAHGSFKELKKSLNAKKGCRLVFLDCVGADAPLHRVSQEGVERVFAASKQADRYVLSSKQLHAKTINQNNIEQVTRWLA